MDLSPEVREAIIALLPTMDQFHVDLTDFEDAVEFAETIENIEGMMLTGQHWGILSSFLKGLL